MSWRPKEGWKNPYEDSLNQLKDYNHTPSHPNVVIMGDYRDIDVIINELKKSSQVFEAGADAMLEVQNEESEDAKDKV